MIKAFLFMMKYKILLDPVNLSYHTKEFFQLSKHTQRKVINQYFDRLSKDFKIDTYFDNKESYYYDGDKEITFFHCYYFDKLILEHDIYNIKLIDKFKLEEEKINYLIGYALEIINEDGIKLRSSDLVNYNDCLPVRLSKNIYFMKYLVNLDYTNIKYLTFNELCPSKQRDLIKEVILKAEKDPYCLGKFLKQDGSLPSILVSNLEFVLYLIKNDIQNVKYFNRKLLDYLTIEGKENFVKSIIFSLDKNKEGVSYIESNPEVALFLNQNDTFIHYIVTINLDYVKYIDWHNLTDQKQNSIIHTIVEILKEKKNKFDVMSYPFRDILLKNYEFMEYLMRIDFRWIAVSKVHSKDEFDRLIQLFFDESKSKNYRFKLADFLEDGKYLNYHLVENKKMFHYLFINKVSMVQHIDFFHLKSSRMVVENLVDELEKADIDYEFCNEDFLIDGKYPVVLSNSYRFMRYVIDKNFNHIAYMDISMIDKRELKRIINYAFRMVYYIRGKNKNLTFDFDGYFKDSEIIDNEYFKECLRSL